MPPSVYLASKSYQSAWATISPGSEVSRLARCRAPSTRPRGRAAEASTITRGSWRSASSTASSSSVEVLDAGDADAGAQPRGLHPERQPELLAAPPPVVALDRGELDLGDAAGGEEPLQGQLVHADRRGEDVGADVGDVEPLEQALDAAVLAEGAVQGREDDVGAEQAGGRGQLDRCRRRDSSRRRGAIVTSTASWPAARRPRGDRGARAQRDVVLGGAAAAEDRDPHGSSSPSSAFGAGRLADRRSSPCRPVPVRSRAAGTGRATRPTWPGDFGFFFFDARDEAGCADRLHRFAAQPCRSRSAPRACSSPAETTIETVEPGSTSLPALGDWLITSPAGGGAFFFGDAGVEAAAADLLHREASRWLPTRTGTLASFGPLETTSVTVEPLVAVRAAGGFGVDHQALFDRGAS